MNMKHLYTSLGSGITSGSVTDNSITNDSVIEIYFDNTDCYIDSTNQSGHTVYFTVGGNATGANVCVVVNNLTNFTPYNDTDIRERVAQTEQDIINLEAEVDGLETTVNELETTVDGLNASNINYDEHSTLYSAMGDIDELETTSKNLVGAINELKESGGGGGSDIIYKDVTISGSITDWTSNYISRNYSAYNIDTSAYDVIGITLINFTGNTVLAPMIGNATQFYVLRTSSTTISNIQLRFVLKNKS